MRNFYFSKPGIVVLLAASLLFQFAVASAAVHIKLSKEKSTNHHRTMARPLKKALSSFAAGSSPTVIYITPAGAGTKDGSSWANAAPGSSIQNKINSAPANAQLWVAAGTYVPNTAPAGCSNCSTDSRTSTFMLVNGISIYGGFAGNETSLTQRISGTNPTIFSGDLKNNDVNHTVSQYDSTWYQHSWATDNAYHIITSINVTNTAIDGVIVQYGAANSTAAASKVGDSTVFNTQGSALYALKSQLTLSNMSFSNNASQGNPCEGGAVYNSGGTFTLTNVNFQSNAAISPGGTIPNNGVLGGAMYNLGTALTFNNVNFQNNLAVGGNGTDVPTGGGPSGGGCYGGGLYVERSTINYSQGIVSNNICVGGTGAYGTVLSGGSGYPSGSGGSTYGGGLCFVSNGIYSTYESFLSTATLSNIQFQGNAGYGGYGGSGAGPGQGGSAFGGACYSTVSQLNISNCSFNNNSAVANISGSPATGWNIIAGGAAFGGGLYNSTTHTVLNHVTFNSNLAQGATDPKATLSRNYWYGTNPFAGAFGGGMFQIGNDFTCNFANFSQNTATSGSGLNGSQPLVQGGGLFLYEEQENDTTSRSTITNTAFTQNSADYQGGGIYFIPDGLPNNSPNFINCTIAGNNVNAVNQVGGLSLYTIGGGTATFDVHNCLIYGNANGDMLNGSQSIIQYSLIGSTYYTTPNAGQPSGDGGLASIFVDPFNTPGNFGVKGTSWTVNKGDPNSASLNLPSTDLAGNPRVLNGIIDLGAYESAFVKSDQTITFNAISSQTNGNPDFSPGASASSGLPVTYTSSDTTVAKIINGAIHIVNVGIVTITASQSGNAIYNAASPVSQMLNVLPSSQIVTFPAISSQVFSPTAIDPGATSSSGLPITYLSSDTTVVKVVNGKLQMVGAGTVTITAIQYGNKGYYAAASIYQTFTITKAAQTITFNPVTINYGNPDFDPGAMTTSGLPITYTISDTTVAKLVNGKFHILKAGAANVTAAQAGTSGYLAAKSVIAKLTINRAAQTITFNTLPIPGYGSTFTPSATSTSGLAVTFASSDTTIARQSGTSFLIKGVGTATITASQAGSSNYLAATPVTQTLTTGKGSQTITFAALAARAYGSADFTISATSTSRLGVTFNSSDTTIAKVSGSTVHIVSTGTVNITASQAGSSLYLAAPPVVQSLTINKAAQIITFAALAAKTYGGADFALSATASSKLGVAFASSDTTIAKVTGSMVHIVSTGTVNITASQAGSNLYLAAAPIVESLTVNKAAQTIVFTSPGTKTYGTADFAPTATVASGLPISFVSSNTAVATVVNGKIHLVGAGTATITASQAGSSLYLTATPVPETLTVRAAALTITANNLSKIYGTPNPVLTVSFSGFVNGETSAVLTKQPLLSTTATTTSPAGNYAIKDSAAVAANYTITYIGGTLTIGKAAQTITFNTLPVPAYGSTFTPSATATSGLAVTFASSDTTIARASGTSFLIKGVGTAIITASQAGGTNYLAATPVAQTLTTGKSSQTITFAALAAKIYGSADFTIAATATSRLGVTFSSSDTTIAKVTGSTVHIVSTGTVNITANQAGSSLYLAAPPVVQSLTINKATQTITFAALAAKTYGAADFALTATATSKLGVTFASSDTTIAKVSGNTVHIVSTGTVNITASQAGSDLYLAATPVVESLTINKATQAIVFTSPGIKYYGTADFAPTATVASKLPISFVSANTAVATIVNGNIHIVGLGTDTIRASQAGNGNYLPATTVAQVLTVRAATVVVTADNQSKVAGTANPILTVSYSGFMNGETPAVLTTQPTIKTTAITTSAAGSYPITASGAAATHYVFSYVAGTLTVSAPTLAFGTIAPQVYGNADFNPGATSNLPLTYTSSNTTVATIVSGNIHIVGVGASTITVTNGRTSLTQQLTVTPATLTVTADSQSKVYGAALPALTVSYSGFVNGDTPSVLTGLPVVATAATASSAAGSYPITVSGGSAANYTLSYSPGALTVTAAPLTIVANNQVKATGKANPALTVNYSGFVNGDTPASLTTLPTVTTTAVTASPNGIYPITASGAVDPNYSFTYVAGTLTISAPTLAFGVLPTQVYGNPDFNPGATSNVAITYTSSSTAVATIVSGNIHVVGFGTATITASNGSTSLTQKLTVSRAAVTITADNQSKVAGLVNPTLTVNYSGFVNGETAAILTTQPLIRTTATTTSVAGSYPITVSGAAAANYAFTYVAGTLTVNAPTLVFNVIPAQVYGNADLSPGAISNLPITYTSSNQSVATIVAGNIHIIGVGVSTITATTIKGSLSQQLTVSPATLIVTATSQNKLYGAAVPALTVSYSGFVNGDTQSVITTQPVLTTTAAITSPVGSYQITATGAAAAKYTMVYVPGSLSVTPAPLTITANNQVKGFGKANPVLTASYYGFVNGDTTSVLATLPTLTTTALTSSPVGSYPINASGAAAANYVISYTAGTLSVVTATLTFNALPTETYGNADFSPGAVSNLPITYTSSNPLVATIVNGNIHMLGFGSASITAANGSLSVVQKLTVGRATLTITASNLSKEAGTANPPLTVSYSGFVNGDTQSVLTAQPLVRTTATTTSAAGTYPITVSSAAATNYLFTYVAGILTVTAAPSALFVAGPPADIARVAYVSVPEPLVRPAVSPNGDGIDDVLQIDNIAAYPDNKLVIISKGGSKVFELAHYDNLNHAFDGHSNINGKMQLQGTYFYVLQYKDANGGAKNTSGYIVLKY